MWSDDCREGHILLGLVSTTAALVLLILVTFSTPFIHTIYFLAAGDVRYGAYGYCSGSACERRLGYSSVGGDIIEWLTRAAICFGLAALFELLALLALVWSLRERATRFNHHAWWHTIKLIATILAVLAEVFALIIWVTARNRFRNHSVDASYGPALWIGLAGALASVFALALGGPKYNGRFMYRAHRDTPYRL